MLEIFQFVSPLSLKTFLSASLPNNSIIYDLEDGVQDVMNPDNNSLLKETARLNLLGYLKKNAAKNKQIKVGFRINTLSGEEFKHDLEFLSEINKYCNIQYLLLPKINSKREIKEYKNYFSDCSISFKELIPIIETVNGYESIKDLFSAPPSDIFHRAFWGHHDYNLDARNWPFAEYYSSEYWRLTTHLIRMIEKANYSYINGAVLQINNDGMLKKIAGVLSGICKKDFDMTALSYSQVKVLSGLKDV
jgi:citrate lyase beta subunit